MNYKIIKNNSDNEILKESDYNKPNLYLVFHTSLVVSNMFDDNM